MSAWLSSCMFLGLISIFSAQTTCGAEAYDCLLKCCCWHKTVMHCGSYVCIKSCCNSVERTLTIMLLRDCIYMCREVGTANSIFTGLGISMSVRSSFTPCVWTKYTLKAWHKYDTGFYNIIHHWQITFMNDWSAGNNHGTASTKTAPTDSSVNW